MKVTVFEGQAGVDTRLIDGVGLWQDRLTDQKQSGSPALFLDRDGVIVEETNYLGRAEDVRMIPQAAKVIKWANDTGLPVIVMTNQAGIGRGYYDWQGFTAVQTTIYERLALEGAHVDLVLACAYHEEGVDAFAIRDHGWRKPNPGMVQAAQNALSLNLSASLIVGDTINDLEAGRRAGVGRGILVATGHGQKQLPKLQASSFLPMNITTARNIGEALSLARADGWPD